MLFSVLFIYVFELRLFLICYHTGLSIGFFLVYCFCFKVVIKNFSCIEFLCVFSFSDNCNTFYHIVLSNLIHYILALSYISENSVFSVKPRCIFVGNEK